MASTSSLYNSTMDATYLERATLLEDIILPELPVFPSLEDIESGNAYYPRAEELYSDTIGKFSIPIITPLSDNSGEVTDTDTSSTVRNIVNASNCTLRTSTYQSSNYLELNIPKYILLNFLDVVPAGTVFIVGFIGGSTTVGDIKVIGVSEFDADATSSK